LANYLVTGCAGFIGAKVAEFLLREGHTVAGVDNLNDAYDVRLKQWRLAQLEGRPRFVFHKLDITNRKELSKLWESQDQEGVPFDAVINLAARAGVRQSVQNPWVYFETNANRHAESAGTVPGVHGEEVRAGVHVQPVRGRQSTSLPGRCEH